MAQDVRPPLPATYVVAPLVFLSFMVAIRPPALMRIGAFCALVIICLRTITSFSVGSNQLDYNIGCIFMMLVFNAYPLLLLSDPMNEFRYEIQGEYKSPAGLPLVRRVYLSLCIVFNVRGVGWNYKVSHLPPSPTEPRSTFILRRLARTACYYLILDAIGFIIYAFIDSHHILADGEVLPLNTYGLAWLLLNISVKCSSAWLGFMMLQSFVSVVHVGLGLSEPRHWPDICGSWLETYTVRGFWGRTWHQLFRRFVAAIGKSTCNFLGFRRGTWQSAYTQLYVAFAISALIHSGGDIMAHDGVPGTSFWFFLSQAVAISFEDLVINLYRRAGIRFPAPINRMIGYIWTFAWGTYSWELFLNYFLRLIARDPRSQDFSFAMLVAQYFGWY